MTVSRDARIDPELRNVLGQRITDARSARGINRNELARRLGTSWALVNRWEQGLTTPSAASLRRLAAALSVPVTRFLAPSEPDESALPADDEDPGFVEFLKRYCPNDVSREEMNWLRRAPQRGEPLLPEGYAAILFALRGTTKR